MLRDARPRDRAAVLLAAADAAELVIAECEHAMQSSRGDDRVMISVGEHRVAVRPRDLLPLIEAAGGDAVAELRTMGYQVPPVVSEYLEREREATTRRGDARR